MSSQAARLTSGKIRLRTPCPRPKEEDPRTLKKLDSMCSGRDCGLAGVRAPQVHLVICYSGSDVARLLWRIKSGHSSQARLGCVLSHSAARRFGGVCACSRAARLLVRELVATPLVQGRVRVLTSSAAPGSGAGCDATCAGACARAHGQRGSWLGSWVRRRRHTGAPPSSLCTCGSRRRVPRREAHCAELTNDISSGR